MAFTYDPEQTSPVSGAPLSAIRFLLQDTIEAEAELQDAEINTVYLDTPDELTQPQRVALAAALCAEAIVTRYSRLASFSSGGTSVNYKDRYDHWRQTYQRLAAQARESVTGSGFSVAYQGRPATF